MPTICEFHGVVIRMYHDDDSPPHFHAYYGEREAIFDIGRLRRITGIVPKRLQAMLIEWAMAHRAELMENWGLAERHEPLKRIEPLE